MITLICGRIGCGKTSYARKMDGLLISIDAVMLHRYPPYLGDEHEAIGAMVRAELLETAAKLSGPVILDWGFWTREERDCTREFFAAHGRKVRLLWIDLPEDELRRRREYRNAHLPKDAYYIDDNLARKCDSQFEPPAPDEKYTRITL